jgi:hypothetical protein
VEYRSLQVYLQEHTDGCAALMEADGGVEQGGGTGVQRAAVDGDAALVQQTAVCRVVRRVGGGLGQDSRLRARCGQ